ncbi:MAG TPA: universal stress protein [Acidimicrobiales bacterium]|nr:universal stress protein [Acidimicrobiales bacterium]
MTEAAPGPVVVGVDGSADGRRALLCALDEARWRGVGVVLIHAFDFDTASMMAYSDAALREIVHAAETVVRAEVEFARDRGVPVEGRTVYGHAAKVLVDEASGASLLVVGSRGRGGLAGALLGSVSAACLHHAACPVLVVPPVGACATPT